MTPKELQYIEDVLGREQQMKTLCQNFANQLQDAELKNFVSGLSDKHGDCYTKFYSLLNS